MLLCSDSWDFRRTILSRRLVIGWMPDVFSADQDNLIDAGDVDQPINELQFFLKKQPQRHQDLVVPPHRLVTAIPETPQTEIQQSGAGRLHAVCSACFKFQIM